MRYAVKPREATRYGARRPEPSVKPLALLNQSLFDKTADGVRAGCGVRGGPGIDPFDQGVRQAKGADGIMPDPARRFVYYIA